MKNPLLSRAGLFLFGLVLCAGFIAQAQLPFRPLYDAPANVQEEQQLSSLFVLARTAFANVESGPNAGFQRRQIGIELNNSGLYYYGYRWFAPNLQRWLNRDPIGEPGGLNLYRFVNNDGVNGFDDTGLLPRYHVEPGNSPSITVGLRGGE